RRTCRRRRRPSRGDRNRENRTHSLFRGLSPSCATITAKRRNWLSFFAGGAATVVRPSPGRRNKRPALYSASAAFSIPHHAEPRSTSRQAPGNPAGLHDPPALGALWRGRARHVEDAVRAPGEGAARAGV